MAVNDNTEPKEALPKLNRNATVLADDYSSVILWDDSSRIEKRLVDEDPPIMSRIEALMKEHGGSSSGSTGTGGTTNYNRLSNKPSINGKTLQGNVTLDLGDKNIVESATFNGLTIPITNKNLDITLDLDLSKFINDTTKFQSEKQVQDYVNQVLSSKVGITADIVDALPDIGKEACVYLIKDSSQTEKSVYTQHMYVNGAWADIGSTEINLESYQKKLTAGAGINIDEATNKISSTLKIPDYKAGDNIKIDPNNYTISAVNTDTTYTAGNGINIDSDNKIGVDLKTINGTSLIGSGDLTITGSDTGTTDYNVLTNKPKINGEELKGDFNISSGDTPVGHLMMYTGDNAPTNYLKCDGSELNIADYKELADNIEISYGEVNYFGGDGVTTFALPNFYYNLTLNGTPTRQSVFIKYKTTITKSDGSSAAPVQPGVTDYNNLTGKPKINGTILQNNLTLAELGITIPTRITDLNNDANYITSSDTDNKINTALQGTISITDLENEKENYYTKAQVDGKLNSVFHYKGVVSSSASLDMLTEKTIGDYYKDQSTGKAYVYNGSGWDDWGDSTAIDLSNYITLNDTVTTTKAGLMTPDDKKKLDALQTGEMNRLESVTFNGQTLTIDANKNSSFNAVTMITADGNNFKPDAAGVVALSGIKGSPIQSISVNGVVQTPSSNGNVNIVATADTSNTIKKVTYNGVDKTPDNNGVISINSLESLTVNGIKQVANNGDISINPVKSLTIDGKSYTPDASGVVTLSNIGSGSSEGTLKGVKLNGVVQPIDSSGNVNLGNINIVRSDINGINVFVGSTIDWDTYGIIPDMTGESSPFGHATSNGNWGGYVAYGAFKVTGSGVYYPSNGFQTGKWVQYEFPSEVTITGWSGYTDTGDQEYTFQISNNGEDFIDVGTGIVNGSFTKYDLTEAKQCKVVRFYLSKGNGSQGGSCARFRVFGSRPMYLLGV